MLIKRLCGVALGAAAAIGLGLSVLPARAAYVVTLLQEDGDLVASGSGSIDLTDLSFIGNAFGVSGLEPFMGEVETGVPSKTVVYGPGVNFKPAPPFGSGLGVSTPTGSGDNVGASGEGISVPVAYVSGSALSDSATYDNATFASIGMFPGVYKWTWGSGANADSFTLDASVVPEPSTWAMMLIGFAGLGFAGYRASRRTAAACT